MTAHFQPVAPSFTTRADVERDMTDVWVEQTDPENVFSEECTGYFDDTDTTLLLTGLLVAGSDTATFHDREHAIKFLGYENVCRVENVFDDERRCDVGALS